MFQSTIEFIPNLNMDIRQMCPKNKFLHPISFQEAVGRLYTLAGYDIFKNCKLENSSFCVTGLFNGDMFALHDSNLDRTVNISGDPNLNTYLLKMELYDLLAETRPKNYRVRYRVANLAYTYSFQLFTFTPNVKKIKIHRFQSSSKYNIASDVQWSNLDLSRYVLINSMGRKQNCRPIIEPIPQNFLPEPITTETDININIDESELTNTKMENVSDARDETLTSNKSLIKSITTFIQKLF